MKIKAICANFDSFSSLANSGVTTTAPSLTDHLVQFDPVVKEKASRGIASYRPTALTLDPFSVWLIRAMEGAMIDWVVNLFNSSLRDRILPSHLKETIICTIIKYPQLVLNNLNNLHLITNIPFLGEVTERVVGNQLQSYLEEQDCIEPFQSGFRL